MKKLIERIKLRMRTSLLNAQGIQLAKQGKYSDAQKAFEEALKLLPGYPSYKINLSTALYDQGQYTRAEALAREALDGKLNRKNQQLAYNNLGNIRFHQKRFFEAIAWYEKAIQVYKPDSEIYYNIGISNKKLGEWEKALKNFRLSNQLYGNLKAQMDIEIVEKLMLRPQEVESVLTVNKGFDINFPICRNYDLTSDESKVIAFDSGKPLLFFVGAGISYPHPSCLPLAFRIVKQLFSVIFNLDRQEICGVFKMSSNISEDEAYIRICRDVLSLSPSLPDRNCALPFETFFEALHAVLNFPVTRIVDILKDSEPNLHHRMLASALHRGHIVVTTNFDRNIEKAYGRCFPEESLNVLVTDKDYKEANDRKLTGGILAKIHGDIEDYNSLVFTLGTIGRSGDNTIQLNNDIHEGEILKRFQTTLSVHKALFLRQALLNRKVVIMGYSGSDVFDIMPILKTSDSNCSGVWVEHLSDSISPAIDEWKLAHPNRFVLQPKSKEDEALDITSKISHHFLRLFATPALLKLTEYSEENLDSTQKCEVLTNSLKSYIDRLRLKPGDGLLSMATLCERRGNFVRARELNSKAIEKYQRDLNRNDFRWLPAKSNMGYILGMLGEHELALNAFNEIKTYIEERDKIELYSSLYPSTLIEIANTLINIHKRRYDSSIDMQVRQLLNKAMELAVKFNDKGTLSYVSRIAARRYSLKGDYKHALDLNLKVFKMTLNAGDIRQACISGLQAAINYIQLGLACDATGLLSQVELLAKLLDDDALLNRIESARLYAKSGKLN